MSAVVCSTSSFGVEAPQALVRLQAAGHEVILNPFGRRLTEGEIADLLRRHAPVGLLAGTEPISRHVLEAAGPQLRTVARVGVGWDNVDLAAADALGISVSRTEGVLNDAVAELALGMLLDVLRKISAQDRQIRNGAWKKNTGRLLSGKTVGIIGFGAIGRRFGELCRAFGCRILFNDPAVSVCGWAAAAALDDLLVVADVVSLHVSGTARLLGATELARCKRGAVIVNTARGGLVDEQALAEALAVGTLGGAALDVFAQEPYAGPLSTFENVVMTPHIGSYAVEARVRMEEMAVDHLLAALEAKPISVPV